MTPHLVHFFSIAFILLLALPGTQLIFCFRVLKKKKSRAKKQGVQNILTGHKWSKPFAPGLEAMTHYGS